MDNRCPKCEKKIRFTYIKQDCPYCGADLVYYDLENRLEKDAEQAEKEFEWVEKKLGPIISLFKKKKKATEEKDDKSDIEELIES